MKKIHPLLPQTRFFKANLHTHTTVSDGDLSPEEAKKAYKACGYQILCLTDHNTIVDHSGLSEPGFLMLTGVEININQPDLSPVVRKTYHLNLIAKRPDNLWTPARAFGKYPGAAGYEEKMVCENMDLQYDPASVNQMIAKAREKGFLVFYNHPTWSCQSYPDYAPLKGLWGVELRNSQCCVHGHNENNFRVYKDLLTLGNPILPLGTDDSHSLASVGQSWVMVGAPELSYPGVISALEKGDLYMSCGPQITGLWVEDNALRITCSPAQSIRVETQGRLANSVVAAATPLREASLSLEKILSYYGNDPQAFLYVTVTAPNGSYAVTRPYYLTNLQ